ncbi:unnamed protein product, partial [Didymodactylos carnosus]
MPKISRFNTSYNVKRKRQRRNERRTVAQSILIPPDTDSDESDKEQEQLIDTEPHLDAVEALEEQYMQSAASLHIIDDSPPLYKDSPTNIKTAVKLLTDFYTSVNLDKKNVLRLLKLFKSLLPQPNLLPTTWKSILKLFDKHCLSSTKYLCLKCDALCHSSKYGQKKCVNPKCLLNKKTLKRTEITEIVTLDIKSQLETILYRNQNILNKNELFPEGDIHYGEFYQANHSQKRNAITLILHCDGAPLAKASKQCLWPCFASIIELPPPIREYQRNIVVVALWAGKKKPNANIFLEDTIYQLKYLMSNKFSLFIDQLEYEISLSTQFFISDLPAKSLFLNTISFNGYYACSYCCTKGEWCKDSRMVLYPYEQNDFTERTHQQFVKAATEAEQKINGGRELSVTGVKGFSILLEVFNYPDQIIFDYMHLICLGHLQSIIKRWCNKLLNKRQIQVIDQQLQQTRLPHNMHVIYYESISSVDKWKAKNGRLFVLAIGVPLMIQHLPKLVASHFTLYSIAIKLLHYPKTQDEITLGEALLERYCEQAVLVYNDKAISLFSLHAHLHLGKQVKLHNSLAFCSGALAILFIKQKIHGSRSLASQIAYWTNIESMIQPTKVKWPSSTGLNRIRLSSSLIDPFRQTLTNLIINKQQEVSEISFYKRFKDKFVTFHTKLYDQEFNCVSYIISFESNQ